MEIITGTFRLFTCIINRMVSDPVFGFLLCSLPFSLAVSLISAAADSSK